MSIDELLPAVQRSQLAQLTAQLLSHGYGRMEVRVEKGQVRWFRPSETVYNPSAVFKTAVPDQTLTELLGAWLLPFQDGLSAVMAAGWGSLYIGVEHGRIRYVEKTPDVRARTGTTGPLASVGA
jgi:hypothetical protein